jgi:hypothetical protein
VIASAAERNRAIAAATLLFYLVGIGGGVANIAVLIYWLRRHDLPYVLGIQLNGGGPMSGAAQYTLFASLFILTCGADVVAGRWLQQYRRRGGVLGLTLVPVELAFAYGFQLPFWWVGTPLRGLLILAGWRHLRRA